MCKKICKKICKTTQSPTCKKIITPRTPIKGSGERKITLEVSVAYDSSGCAQHLRYGKTSSIFATKVISAKPDLVDVEVGCMSVFGRPFQCKNPGTSTGATVKLKWDGLLTADGRPLCSYPHIIHRFRHLRAAGWTVHGTGVFYRTFGQ